MFWIPARDFRQPGDSQRQPRAPCSAAPPPSPAAAPGAPGGAGTVASPIAGTVVELKCNVGDSVTKGQPLLVIDAMKMNTSIASPLAGKVAKVNVAAGDRCVRTSARGARIVPVRDVTDGYPLDFLAASLRQLHLGQSGHDRRGCLFLYLAITQDYDPLLLVPIGFGILIGNIPFREGLNIGVYEEEASSRSSTTECAGLVPAPHLSRHRRHDRFFVAPLESNHLVVFWAAAPGLASFPWGHVPRLQHRACRGDRDYRWSGRPHGHLSCLADGARLPRRHRDCRVLLYGTRTRDPAAHRPAPHAERRAVDPDETMPPGEQADADSLPDRRASADHGLARLDPAARYAVLRQSAQGVWRHRAPGQDRAHRLHRHHHDPARADRGGLDRCVAVSSPRDSIQIFALGAAVFCVATASGVLFAKA